MERLDNGYILDIPPGCFPLGTDSLLLSRFVRLPASARVLDLGSGCGTLGLLLCARSERCRVTGVELDPAAHQAALENIRRNGLACRMDSICADLRRVPEMFPAGAFSCCVSNPPYFSGGPNSARTPLARRQDACGLEELFRAASWALKYGGDFCLVHRPEQLGALIAAGARQGLEAKRLLLARHRAGSPVNLIAAQFRKGAKPGLCWEETILTAESSTGGTL